MHSLTSKLLMKVLRKEVYIELKINSKRHVVREMNAKTDKREVAASTLISTTSM